MSKESKLSLSVSDEDTYDETQIERETSDYESRDRVPFSTTLNAGLYEKLKAIHFYEGAKISDIVNEAVHRAVEELEAERDEPYDVPEPLRIEDS